MLELLFFKMTSLKKNITKQRFLDNQREGPVPVENNNSQKQKFLLEHNKLSPLSLQATTGLLSLFKSKRLSLFKDDTWPIDKLRRPFVLWLTSLTSKEREDLGMEGRTQIN